MINSKPAGNCSIIPFIALDILRKTIKYSRRSPCDPTLVSNNSYYCHSSCYQLRPCTILNLKPLLNCNRRVHVIVSDRSFYKRPPPFFFVYRLVFILTFKFYSVVKKEEVWPRGQSGGLVILVRPRPNRWLVLFLLEEILLLFHSNRPFQIVSFLFLFFQRLTGQVKQVCVFSLNFLNLRSYILVRSDLTNFKNLKTLFLRVLWWLRRKMVSHEEVPDCFVQFV